jgi:hypothetical protein
MLIQSLGGTYGYGYGLGAAALTQGKDFNCNAAICYAIGKANDGLFKQLQQAINTLSKAGGFAPLVVDGFIGDKTVLALKALVKLGLEAAPSTKEQVAAQAPNLLPALSGIASSQASRGQTLAPPGAPVVYEGPRALPTPPMVTSTQIPDTSHAAALPKPKSKTLWWILGGLAAVTAVGGVGYVVYRRRA